MAHQYLVNINVNDSLQDVIRKCNQNFRLVSNASAQNVRQQSSQDMSAITEAIALETSERQGADQLLNQRIDNIEVSGDYTVLVNKPKINNVELDGNKTSEDLYIINQGVISTQDIYSLFS